VSDDDLVELGFNRVAARRTHRPTGVARFTLCRVDVTPTTAGGRCATVISTKRSPSLRMGPA